MVKVRAANFFLAIQKGIAFTLPFLQVKVIHIRTLRVAYNFHICLSHSKINFLVFSFIQSTNIYLVPAMCQILYNGRYLKVIKDYCSNKPHILVCRDH